MLACLVLCHTRNSQTDYDGTDITFKTCWSNVPLFLCLGALNFRSCSFLFLFRPLSFLITLKVQIVFFVDFCVFFFLVVQKKVKNTQFNIDTA